jgi:hypothetical protein
MLKIGPVFVKFPLVSSQLVAQVWKNYVVSNILVTFNVGHLCHTEQLGLRRGMWIGIAIYLLALSLLSASGHSAFYFLVYRFAA